METPPKSKKAKQQQEHPKPRLKEEWKETEYEGKSFYLVKEGEANILYPKDNEVFYNPVQEVNRDLSVLMLQVFQEKVTNEMNTKKKKGW